MDQRAEPSSYFEGKIPKWFNTLYCHTLTFQFTSNIVMGMRSNKGLMDFFYLSELLFCLNLLFSLTDFYFSILTVLFLPYLLRVGYW